VIKINSISDVIHKYDNFIIDQWGVMHDGITGYTHAIKTIDYLQKKNKNLFLISNSSKRKKSSEEKLPKLGFNKDSFVSILTSGEMIWKTIYNEYSRLEDKKKCFHIYNKNIEDGLTYRHGLNLLFVEKIEDADLILACTPFDNMKPIDYIPILSKALENKIKMYCANPDFETVEKNSKQNVFCMGAISEIYTKMGGEVLIQGKPEIDIYIETTKSIKLNKAKTVAIGDSIFHDIKGANNFSIDSILVKSGIHKKIETISMLCENHKISPTYLIDDFCI
tara:strand:+ start:772 stop:1608 length:837 start_codon:yes stop_codon:yes gene_type:complete